MNNKIKINFFVGVLFFCIFISFLVLNISSKRVFPIFIDYTSSKVKNISTMLINRAINEHLSNFDTEKIISITKNSDNEIQMIDFNSMVVNEVLKSTTESVLESLKMLEKGNVELFDIGTTNKYNNGTIYEIPLGIISNNLFLSNFGPYIPIKLNIIGDVYSNINTEIKEYGINNALVEISINVTISEKVIVPFISETISISTDVPIFLKIIQGDIPIYYGTGISKGSNILSIPTE